MYVIREAMSKYWYPLAVLFSLCAMVGCLPIFQANQLTQVIVDIGLQPFGIKESTFQFAGFKLSTPKFIIGATLMVVVGTVILGGIKRIGMWAGRMVPLMIVLYFFSVIAILIINIEDVPGYLALIVSDAFSADFYSPAALQDNPPLFGGVLGALIIAGVRRASFSNEAGIGTAPMALGASKSVKPIREGLVSMLSPAIDTLIVCTMTALVILSTGVWKTSSDNGVTLTGAAFESSLGSFGQYILLICAFFFAITSLFSYSYYGSKSLSFLIGVKGSKWYNYFYLLTILPAAVAEMSDIINIIDIAYALMAFPTMISGFVLAPRVMKEAKAYFASLKNKDF
jgi:AGCS family alanine or glycine:cation symporter